MVHMMSETDTHNKFLRTDKSTGLTLVGDVGGTNCRLALAERTASGAIELHHSERYAVAEYKTFNDVVAAYLKTHGVKPKQGAFAFAGLLSGPGLVRLHTAICAIMDTADNDLTAAEIVGAAELDKGSVARVTVNSFCSMLGGFAGNVAVTQGTSGGVVVGGGVSRHIAKFIAGSEFVSRFKDRGPGSWYVKDIPVRLIQANFVPLYGAAAMVLKD